MCLLCGWFKPNNHTTASFSKSEKIQKTIKKHPPNTWGWGEEQKTPASMFLRGLPNCLFQAKLVLKPQLVFKAKTRRSTLPNHRILQASKHISYQGNTNHKRLSKSVTYLTYLNRLNQPTNQHPRAPGGRSASLTSPGLLGFSPSTAHGLEDWRQSNGGPPRFISLYLFDGFPREIPGF